MKIIKILLIPLLLFLSIRAFSQAPAIQWQKEYWAEIFPGTNTTQTQSQSGEDWFYDVKLSVGADGEPDGYICSGYSSFVNWSRADSLGCHSLYSYAPYCGDFQDSSHVKGDIILVMAKVDLCGKLLWYKPTYMYGDFGFKKVIQTSDGSYIAIGRTVSTENWDPASPYTHTLVKYRAKEFVNSSETSGYFDKRNPITNCPNDGNIQHTIMIKRDRDGNQQWINLYGLKNFTGNGDSAYNAVTMGWDLVETDSGSVMTVGSDLSYGYVMEVNISDGSVKWSKKDVTKGYSYAIARYGSGSGTRFVIGGDSGTVNAKQTTAGTACLKMLDNTSSHSTVWSKTYGPVNVVVRDIDIDLQNQVILPLQLRHSVDEEATVTVYRVNSANGNVIDNVSLSGIMKAEDLSSSVAATSDSGFVYVSSKKTSPWSSCAPNPACTYYDSSVWNTDAYVAKYSKTLVKQWDQTYDNTVASRLSGACSTWVYPDLTKDVAKQECLFGVLQSPEGGYVFCGKSSSNFDDSYLTKLAAPNCDSTAINNSKINYDKYVYCKIITANKDSIVNPGDVDFKASKYILIAPSASADYFLADYNSDFLAAIDTSEVCNGVGYRFASESNSYILPTSTVGRVDPVSIYPNPNSGVFNIDIKYSIAKNVEYSVLNSMGEEVLKKQLGNIQITHEELDLNNVQAGMYFIKIKSNNEFTTKKIIIIK